MAYQKHPNPINAVGIDSAHHTLAKTLVKSLMLLRTINPLQLRKNSHC